MTPDQFKSRLDYLGLNQSRFAKLIYVHPNTVSKWMTGQARIPGPVIAYLDLADGVKAISMKIDW